MVCHDCNKTAGDSFPPGWKLVHVSNDGWPTYRNITDILCPDCLEKRRKDQHERLLGRTYEGIEEEGW